MNDIFFVPPPLYMIHIKPSDAFVRIIWNWFLLNAKVPRFSSEGIYFLIILPKVCIFWVHFAYFLPPCPILGQIGRQDGKKVRLFFFAFFDHSSAVYYFSVETQKEDWGVWKLLRFLVGNGNSLNWEPPDLLFELPKLGTEGGYCIFWGIWGGQCFQGKNWHLSRAFCTMDVVFLMFHPKLYSSTFLYFTMSLLIFIVCFCCLTCSVEAGGFYYSLYWTELYSQSPEFAKFIQEGSFMVGAGGANNQKLSDSRNMRFNQKI